MENFEDNKGKSLPYLTTKENVKKLIEATKLKEGAEESIRSFFGKGKYADTKRTLQSFNVISEDMKLTEIGRTIAYASEEDAENQWFKIVMNYPPYEEFVQSFRVNYKEGNDSIDLEEVKRFWGLREYGSSDNNRSDALTTFAYFIVMSGIGEFKIGRHKNPSRIIIWKNRLEEKIQLINDNSSNYNQNTNVNENIEEKHNESIENNERDNSSEKEIIESNKSSEYYTINIPIDSGATAKVYIPRNATKEDAELIKDMVDVIFKRKFGI